MIFPIFALWALPNLFLLLLWECGDFENGQLPGGSCLF